MFPNGLPAKRPRNLQRRVRAALAQNHKWTDQDWPPVSRHTVISAWELLSQK